MVVETRGEVDNEESVKDGTIVKHKDDGFTGGTLEKLGDGKYFIERHHGRSFLVANYESDEWEGKLKRLRREE